MKNQYSDAMVIQEARTLIGGHYSTYELSGVLGIPQSTLWWHMARRLEELDPELYIQAKELLKGNNKGGGR